MKSRRRTVGAPLGAAACVACPALVDERQPVAQPAVQHRLALRTSFDPEAQMFDHPVDQYDSVNDIDFLHLCKDTRCKPRDVQSEGSSISPTL